MFKWIIKKYKIWRLTRRWVMVYYRDTQSSMQAFNFCPGRSVHRFFHVSRVEKLVRIEDGEWYSLNKNWTMTHYQYSSAAIEKVYQEYLTELQELSML